LKVKSERTERRFKKNAVDRQATRGELTRVLRFGGVVDDFNRQKKLMVKKLKGQSAGQGLVSQKPPPVSVGEFKLTSTQEIKGEIPGPLRSKWI